jgi:hypothetical protein
MGARMSKIVSSAIAATLVALLTAGFVTTLGASSARAQGLGSDMQGSPRDAPTVPGIYDIELCVVSIDKDAKVVTFIAPNPENPNAAVAFVFKHIKGFKKGDLVKLKPAAESTAKGEPTVKVLEASSKKCHH